jgi:hypothetical protein
MIENSDGSGSVGSGLFAKRRSVPGNVSLAKTCWRTIKSSLRSIACFMLIITHFLEDQLIDMAVDFFFLDPLTFIMKARNSSSDLSRFRQIS